MFEKGFTILVFEMDRTEKGGNLKGWREKEKERERDKRKVRMLLQAV